MLSFARLAPAAGGYAGPIVTVLAPGAAAPAVSWLLAEVNGQIARSIGPPVARTATRSSAR